MVVLQMTGAGSLFPPPSVTPRQEEAPDPPLSFFAPKFLLASQMD